MRAAFLRGRFRRDQLFEPFVAWARLPSSRAAFASYSHAEMEADVNIAFASGWIAQDVFDRMVEFRMATR